MSYKACLVLHCLVLLSFGVCMLMMCVFVCVLVVCLVCVFVFCCISCMSFARVCAVLFIGWFALLLFSVVLHFWFACICFRFVLLDSCLLLVFVLLLDIVLCCDSLCGLFCCRVFALLC